jgi:hypothetical protein
MLVAANIPVLHDRATAFWHGDDLSLPEPSSAFERLVLEQHRANFDLWHQEDEARNLKASDATIAQVKHTIDSLNQRRNDLVEQLDLDLLSAVEQVSAAPLNSETPGLLIDRLSILALKLFHTTEETQRPGATEAHKLRNRERLRILREQRDDLTGCLGELWREVGQGTRRFKLYRQMKMYNDPSLNPVLYRDPEPENVG